MATKGKTSTGGNTKASNTSKKVNYNYDSTKETASQYNARVAQERGDSSSQLKSMQATTASTFKDKGLDANKLSAPIPVNALNPASPITGLPSTPTPGMPDTTVDATNQGIASPMDGLTYENGKFTFTPPTTPTDTSAVGILKQRLDAMNQLQSDMPSSEKTWNQLDKKLGYTQTQNEVNSLAGQLNEITANRDARVIALEGQGRGITTDVLGGQAAQIEREAAIRALPVQAALSLAQGRLDMAQQQMTRLFEFKMQDAKQRYTFNSQVLDAVFDYADKQEQNRLADIRRKEDKAWELTKMNIGDARDLALKASEYGQTSLASKIMGLDFQNDPQAMQKLATYQGQIVKPTSGDSGWEIKEVNGQSMWVNTKTKAIEPIGGSDGSLRTLSYEDNARFNATPEATGIKDATAYAEAVKNYKKAIEDYGTGELIGKGRGKLNDTYQALVGTTKDYYTLGTYDNGVQKLISLGIPEPSVLGITSTRLSALDSALATAKEKIQRNVAQLESTRYGNSVEFKQLVDNATKVVGDADAKVVNWGLFDNGDLQDLQTLGLSPISSGTNYESYFK